jgi:hypothetical protein
MQIVVIFSSSKSSLASLSVQEGMTRDDGHRFASLALAFIHQKMFLYISRKLSCVAIIRVVYRMEN